MNNLLVENVQIDTYKDTIDEQWIKKALKSFDETKITTIDV